MKFKPGQKVLVKSYGYDPDDLTHQMKQFIGKVVTIRSDNSGNRDWPYRIEEDRRWVWREKFFTHCGEATDPNILFQLRKGR